jgi:hypothetical protein
MTTKTKNTKTKLTPEERRIVKGLNRIFTVEGWEIPDACVVGKFSAKVRDLEARVSALENKQVVRRIDPVAALKGARP